MYFFTYYSEFGLDWKDEHVFSRLNMMGLKMELRGNARLLLKNTNIFELCKTSFSYFMALSGI